jgi:radical SAM enzyme (TIGR01210 family)
MNHDLRLREKIGFLQGGTRNCYDVIRKRIVRSATVFVAYGCPDWGNPDGIRNRACTFCPLPQSAEAYRHEFYGDLPIHDHVEVFAATLREIMSRGEYDTLNIFNAGSFPAMPAEIQTGVLEAVVQYPSLRRVVVESRAPLITNAALDLMCEPLRAAGIDLTIRIGVESQDDHIRLRVLRKGHTRVQLASAVDLMRARGICSGAYVLLNPAPGLDPTWAESETLKTFDWVLRELGMDEAYFGPTCVGAQTRLADEWRAGRFTPSSLWSVYRVLTKALAEHGKKVHLLRFSDEPPFLAVPSNHVPGGIPESLEGAVGCDREFHSMFEVYRETLDPAMLHPINCSCKPDDIR